MAKNENKLSESLEDYLEAILYLETKNKVARVKDISDHMNILRGGVTQSLKKLAKKGLINYEPYSFITLTPKGMSIAKKITNNHKIIKDFLENILQVSDDKAEIYACRIEHAMDTEIINRLIAFMEYIRKRTKNSDNDDLVEEFVNYYKHDFKNGQNS